MKTTRRNFMKVASSAMALAAVPTVAKAIDESTDEFTRRMSTAVYDSIKRIERIRNAEYKPDGKDLILLTLPNTPHASYDLVVKEFVSTYGKDMGIDERCFKENLAFKDIKDRSYLNVSIYGQNHKGIVYGWWTPITTTKPLP